MLALLGAWVVQMIWPVALWAGVGGWLRVVGVVLLCLGVSLDLAAMHAMHRARTNVLPHRGAQHLVTTGVFAFSRNPIYFGNTLALVGVALALRLPWLLVTTLIVAVLVDRLAIRREERHLSARFGAAFTDYARRVPRWLGIRRV
ncbi:MAG TPA: isoprenylcysteine carboxylmethyltransferase family protein [Rhodanobacteraceae bacterium]|nr:isoprenylcysteine carboxylmethyltransferase family protein [Rhodanobacteraceae bacterium]